MMEKDRMRLARVRAPKQDHVGLFDFAVRARPAARSEHCRQTDDARRVSSPVATVDVVRANHRAHEFLGHIVQFVGGLRAAEHAKCARPALFHLRAESICHTVQRLVPTRGTVPPILTNQRDRKSTRLNSSHGYISYAVFCLKKKKYNNCTRA